MSTILEIENQLNDFKNREQLFPGTEIAPVSAYRGRAPSESVVRLQLNLQAGLHEDLIRFPLAERQIKISIHEITAIVLEFMIPADCDIPGIYIGIGMIISMVGGRCLTMEPKNAGKLPRGQWLKLEYEVEAGHYLKIDGRVDEIRMTLSCSQSFIGTLLISKLELVESPRIALKAMVQSKSERNFDAAYSRQKIEGSLPIDLSKDSLFRLVALFELAQIKRVLLVGLRDDEVLGGVLPGNVKELVSIKPDLHSREKIGSPAESLGVSTIEHLSGDSFDQLSRLIISGRNFQCVFIWGNSRFDYALAETFYGGVLLERNGLLLIGNSSTASVSKVIKFYDTNRNQNFKKIGELFSGCTIFGKIEMAETRAWDHFVGLF